MNDLNHRAGKSTREMADKRYKSRLWFVVPLSIVVLLLFVAAWNSSALGIGAFGFFGLIILIRLIMDFVDVRAGKMMKEERRAVRGARAEEKIGSLLDELGDGYLIIHDVSSSFGNIDHVVLNRQGGIFVVETKAHGGRVSVIQDRLMINGHDPEKDFIAQALNNTYWLRDVIKRQLNIDPWITPVVVFTNAFVERTAPIKGVAVVNKKYLPNLLSKYSTRPANKAVWDNRELLATHLSGD